MARDGARGTREAARSGRGPWSTLTCGSGRNGRGSGSTKARHRDAPKCTRRLLTAHRRHANEGAPTCDLFTPAATNAVKRIVRREVQSSDRPIRQSSSEIGSPSLSRRKSECNQGYIPILHLFLHASRITTTSATAAARVEYRCVGRTLVLRLLDEPDRR